MFLPPIFPFLSFPFTLPCPCGALILQNTESQTKPENSRFSRLFLSFFLSFFQFQLFFLNFILIYILIYIFTPTYPYYFLPLFCTYLYKDNRLVLTPIFLRLCLYSFLSGPATMTSGICSQGLVLATAMVVSSTLIFLTFSRQKALPPPKQTLRSCLSSEGKKRDKKKKKVKFAENVKETSGNGEEYRKEQQKKLIAATVTAGTSTKVDRFCRNEMPANRVALYNGILRDRVHRTECSY
ncbi:uncharacterized protein LOC111318535 [Durio zibethinus]|uniref:Uncharacterized protein LOC111318535 n=1 Tax=Durio zibethinus TaxID=66656 RepID=A0A6P6BJ39_DURZI|nr:uncharacterized protein LOC111318535 [Durio zibethinus]